MKVRTLFGAAPTPLVDVHRLLVLHRTVTIHDTRFAHPHHKWGFVDEITPCAWFYADPQRRYTTVRRVRTTWPGAGIHFPSRRCYHVCSTTCCLHVYTYSVSSSQCHIVVPRHSGSDTKLAVSAIYVELLRDEASKYCSFWAFVRVGIVEWIWEEEVVQPSKPLTNGDTQKTPLPLTTVGAGNPSQPASSTTFYSASEKPPVPRRRRRFWEMASAFGELSVGVRKAETTPRRGRRKKRRAARRSSLPHPLPILLPHPYTESSTSRVGALDSPLFPKRNVVHGRATIDTVVPPPGTQNGIAAAEINDPSADANGHIDPDTEIAFATPSFEASPPPLTTSYPVTAELSTPPTCYYLLHTPFRSP